MRAKKPLSLLLLLTLMAGCHRQSTFGARGEGIVFDSIATDSTTRLTDSREMPSGELSIHLAYANPQGGDPQSVAAAWKINQALLASGPLMPDYMAGVRLGSTKGLTPKSYMQKALRQIADNFGKLYKADYLALYKEVADFSPSYSRSYTVRTKVTQANDSLVNYVAETYYYDGGAHGQSTTWARNFNTRTGSIVKLDNILRPGYKRPLTQLIVDKLVRQFNVASLHQLQDEAYVFMNMEPYVPKNYLISDEGITFIYCQDEIAPHAVGEIRLTLTNKQLAGMMHKQ